MRLADDVVVTLPEFHAGQSRRAADPEQVRVDPPIIRQYLNAETADNLLVLIGTRKRPAVAVLALDERGQTWSLEAIADDSPAEEERGRLIWRRLWVPPLPDGGEHA
jgi:hypothetical protein